MTAPIRLDHVRAALDLPAFDVDSAWARMHLHPNPRPKLPPPGADVREAAVLALIYPTDLGLVTLLIQRAPDPGVHSGQIGFPGGGREPDDADLVATALREACEEIGVCRDGVTVLGALTRVYIPPSGYLVSPFVGTVDSRPVFRTNPLEVASLLELPLRTLLDDGIKGERDGEVGGMRFRVPYYDVDGHVVWGATALMLSELEGRLRAALADSEDGHP
jgi:8-oxo-dGTP pyrophosphatase MutT (NUDIX family)